VYIKFEENTQDKLISFHCVRNC